MSFYSKALPFVLLILLSVQNVHHFNRLCGYGRIVAFALNPYSRSVCIRILTSGHMQHLSHCDFVNKILVIIKY